MEWGLLAAAVGIGIVVGLTGMGGGALMTPMLVLFFNVPAPVVISSDLVTAMPMKTVGSAVHAKKGTVQWSMVAWLVGGSVPGAIIGTAIVASVGITDDTVGLMKMALGAVLLLAAASIVARAILTLREDQRIARGLPTKRPVDSDAPVQTRALPTLLVGLIGGLMVGLTSVGSGTLIIIALMALYPALPVNRLVGTDLVQAVPLVLTAGIGHMLVGHVDWSLVATLVAGSVPGAYIGAKFSSSGAAGVIKKALVVILVASGSKLLGASNVEVLFIAGAALVVCIACAIVLRKADAPAEREPVSVR